jgi:hypothetical protein
VDNAGSVASSSIIMGERDGGGSDGSTSQRKRIAVAVSPCQDTRRERPLFMVADCDGFSVDDVARERFGAAVIMGTDSLVSTVGMRATSLASF